MLLPMHADLETAAWDYELSSWKHESEGGCCETELGPSLDTEVWLGIPAETWVWEWEQARDWESSAAGAWQLGKGAGSCGGSF